MKEMEGSSPRDILNAVFRRIYILKIMVVVLPLATLAASYLVPPVYESTAKILVAAKQENANLLLVPKEAGLNPIISLNVDEMDLNSEMELLLSPDLWMRTVKALGLKFFEKRKESPVGKWWANVKQAIKDQLAFIASSETDEGGKKGDEIRLLARRLVSVCSIVPVSKSKVLDVKFRYDDPAKAEKILSTHLELYIPYHMEVYSSPEVQQLFLGQEDKFKQKMVEATERLQVFKKEWGISSPAKQKEEVIAQIKGLQDTLIEITADVIQYENMLSSLKKDVMPTGQLTETMGRAKENTVISVLASQLLQALQKRLEVGLKFSKESPDYVAADDLVKSLTNRFRDTLIVQLENLHYKKESLEKSLQQKQSQLSLLDEKAQELTNLELETTIAKERYLKYASKQDDARMDSVLRGQQVVNVRILSRPSFPVAPVFPKKGLLIMGAFVLSFPLGLGMIFVANFFDHTFQSPQQVKAATGYKVLVSLRHLDLSPSYERG